MNSTPIEIVFDRYFHSEEFPILEKRHYFGDEPRYAGRLDTEGLSGAWPELLVSMRDTLNENLSTGHGVDENGRPRVYFDFIKSTVQNAITFQFEGCRFIGVTFPLLQRLMSISGLACASKGLQRRFGKYSEESLESLAAQFFLNALVFILGHEHGHYFLDKDKESVQTEFLNEVEEADIGSLSSQAREIHADGYGVFLSLFHILSKDQIAESIVSLKIAQKNPEHVILDTFIIAVAIYFFTRRPIAVENVLTSSHPLQVVRINYVMDNIKRWCATYRPDLNEVVTLGRFSALLAELRESTTEDFQTSAITEQNQFLLTAEGVSYLDRLRAEIVLQHEASKGAS